MKKLAKITAQPHSQSLPTSLCAPHNSFESKLDPSSVILPIQNDSSKQFATAQCIAALGDASELVSLPPIRADTHGTRGPLDHGFPTTCACLREREREIPYTGKRRTRAADTLFRGVCHFDQPPRRWVFMYSRSARYHGDRSAYTRGYNNRVTANIA